MNSFCISSNLGLRRRAELDLGGSEPLDQNHGSATQRANPEWGGLAGCFGVRRHRMRYAGCAGGQQLFTKRNKRTTAAAGQETEVADADEATRQHMQQKATQELIDRQSQESLLVFVSGISPAKRDLVIQE